MAEDWREAIAQYEADKAAGIIVFGPGEFAYDYPGHAESEAAIKAWLETRIPWPYEDVPLEG